MLTPTQIQRAKPKLLLIQIISAGILWGALIFSAVILAMTDWAQFPGDGKMMSLLGALTGFALLGLAWIVPSLIATSTTGVAAEVMRFRQSRESEENEKVEEREEKIMEGLLASEVMGRIVFYAIIEAAVFLNLMVFFIEKNTISLAIVVMGLLVMLLGFPFQSRMLNRIDDRMPQVKDEMRLIDR